MLIYKFLLDLRKTGSATVKQKIRNATYLIISFADIFVYTFPSCNGNDGRWLLPFTAISLLFFFFRFEVTRTNTHIAQSNINLPRFAGLLIRARG